MDGQEKRMSRKNSYHEGTKAGTNERTREMEEGRMKGGEGRKEGRAPRKEQSKGGRKKEGRKEQRKEEKEGRREKAKRKRDWRRGRSYAKSWPHACCSTEVSET
jgi:hypothetical protein